MIHIKNEMQWNNKGWISSAKRKKLLQELIINLQQNQQANFKIKILMFSATLLVHCQSLSL